MDARYHCTNERRKQAVAKHATLNGIDYLEVLDNDAPAGSPRQQTLFVQLLRELDPGVTLDADNVKIEGGVRISPVSVVWAYRASDAADLHANGLISEEERDLFLERDQPTPGDLLVVRTDGTGDFSSYRLALVEGDAPLPTLDPPLSTVTFSFKADCPSDFDCAPVEQCPPEPQEIPPIDYLARDYAGFRQLMLDRLSVVMPEWRERSPADIGGALVEVLAYAADRISYQQDAVATEAYLGTARRRTSIRRHARLLDYAMHDGVNARAWVVLRAAEGVSNAVVRREYLPGNPTRLLTRLPDYPPLIDEDAFAEILGAHRPEVFELLYDLRLFSAHNEIRFHTWGDEACCLPKGATRATLCDDEANRLLLCPGDILVFEEVMGPETGDAADADPAHRHVVRLTRVEPAAIVDEEGNRSAPPVVKDELLNQPIVEIEWAPADELPFPLCISAIIEDADGQERLVEDISLARGNVVLADHGRTMPVEPLPPPTGDRWYRPVLSASGVTQAVPFVERDWLAGLPAETGEFTAATAGVQDPQRALPAISLHDDDGESWHPERDLLASDRFEPGFVAETEEDGSVRVRFGDGMFGRRPREGVAINATFRIGSGQAGNVGAGAIYHILTTPGIGIDVSDPAHPGIRNPLPAAGGAAPETLDEVRLYAPQAFRRQDRAVTEKDYAEVAQRHPQVSKAVARRLWTGSWHTMFITTDRVGGRPIDDAFEADLREWLGRYKLAGHDVEIEPPIFVPLDIALTVCVKPGYFRAHAKAALLEIFSSRDLPDGRRGYFHPDNFTFNQRVYLSPIIAAAMEVPGVRWVSIDPDGDPPGRFQRRGEKARGEIEQGFIEIRGLEIARLDNDPNAPENGQIVLHMEGGL